MNKQTIDNQTIEALKSSIEEWKGIAEGRLDARWLLCRLFDK